mgnify:CR=1 FL=1
MASPTTYRKTKQGETREESTRCRLEKIRTRLEIEQQKFINAWRDQGDFLYPERPQFQTTDKNQGDVRNLKILDCTATDAIDTLASAMMGGITSPALRWLKLTTQNPWIGEIPAVQSWLYTIEQMYYAVMARSNLYRSLPTGYLDLITFSTGAMMIVENMVEFHKVIHSEVFPVGSYKISSNSVGDVDTFQREFRMTVRQLIEQFGKFSPDGKIKNLDIFSAHVQSLWMEHDYEAEVDVCHFIVPNENFDPTRSKYVPFKRYSEYYYERGMGTKGPYSMTLDDEDKILRMDGYNTFPVIVFRWRVTGQDSYGKGSPGWRILGDVKQLQQMEKFILQAVEKSGKPALLAPTDARTTTVTGMAGDVTYYDESGDRQIKPLYQIDPRIQEMEMKQEQTRTRIRKICKEELFLALTNIQTREKTATEVQAIEGEKTTVLGPVLQQVSNELDRLVDIFWEVFEKRGMIPPPPQELAGQVIKVEYVSPMHNAQKLTNVQSFDRFLSMCVNLSQTNPQIWDKVNVDEIVDEYADLSSVKPGILRDQRAVDAARQQRAQMQQQQMMSEAMKNMAGSVKDLGSADIGDNKTALQALAGR